MRVLVSAANGKTGKHVISALRRSRQEIVIRGFARSTIQMAGSVSEAVFGDMDDPASRAKAVEGVDAVIHYGPPVDPRETAIGTGMIDAAVAAGVTRFIYVSVLHPQIEDLSNHISKLAVETYLINAGIDWTIIRPQHFMQNVDVAKVLAAGELVMPYRPDGILGHVDLADVAEAAVKVTLEPGHSFAAYDADGGDNKSALELCAILEEISGKPIKYRQITADEQIEIRSRGKKVTNYTIEGYHRVVSYYSRRGISGNPNVLRWLLGREPNKFVDFVRRSMASGPVA